MASKHDLGLIGIIVFAVPFLVPWFHLPTPQLWIATGFGFVVGILSGSLGMGGVWLMVPSLTYLFGTDIKVAIGTALTAQVLITLFGSYEHIREKAVGQKIATPLIIGGIAGTPLGVWLNTLATDSFLNWAYAILLTAIGVKLFLELRKTGGGAEQTAGRDMGRDMVGETIDTIEAKTAAGMDQLGTLGRKLHKITPAHIRNNYHDNSYEVDTLTMVLAGILFGTVNGLLGSSTVLMVPFLDVLMHLDIHVATAASLLNVTAISIPASANHILLGNIDINLAAFIAGSGIIGALIGSRINEHTPQRLMQYIMLGLIAVMAYYMLPVKPF